MKKQNIMWPAHYPEMCPPGDAENVAGMVYRFTSKTIPKFSDFISYYELKPDKDWGDKACQARGLSVYTTEEDCRAARAAVPALKKKKLCVAELPAEAGVIALTPSKNTTNHKTFWSLLGAEELSEIFIPLETMEVAHVYPSL